MQAHDERFPQSPGGSLYPTHYVVGVIDDLREAEQAEQAFKDAGYDAGGIRLFEGQEAVEKAQKLEEQKNWLQQFLSSFQDTTDETGVSIYRKEAHRGHNILNVRADSRQEVESIRDLMTQFHAHALKYFGPWSVEDLPPRQFL